jgi:hypothetical protein
MKFSKYDLIPLVLSIGAVLVVGLTKTRYDLELERMASETLPNMPATIGDYWAEGKMPVQMGNYEIISFGNPSNPFSYVGPSVELIKHGVESVIYHFTLRDLLPNEVSVIQAFNNGDFTGLREYATILGLDAAYVAGRFLVSKHAANTKFDTT